jgi:ammonia channel protein AmtB
LRRSRKSCPWGRVENGACWLTIPRAALVSGVAIRGVPTGQFLVFITFWSLFVYNPVARWSWHWAGWSNQRGVMDFAGGTAVHITSGTAVLAFHVFYMLDTKGFKRCWKGFWPILVKPLIFPWKIYKNLTGRTGVLVPPPTTTAEENGLSEYEMGKITATSHDRGGQEAPTPLPTQSLAQSPSKHPELDETDKPPHNMNYMVLGTALLWIGWFGFNGGSALGGNLRAVSACVSTHVAACSGGITSLFIFWLWCAVARYFLRTDFKWPSVTHFCDGVIIGLVAVTPAAGYASVLILNHEFELTQSRSPSGALESLDSCQQSWLLYLNCYLKRCWLMNLCLSSPSTLEEAWSACFLLVALLGRFL